jgi:type I restriction enzyme S subunit
MKSEAISDSVDRISEAAIANSAASLIPTGAILIVVRSGILARTIPVAITGRTVTINQDLNPDPARVKVG